MGKYTWDLEIKYHPDQPRIPEGQPGGGQWTAGSGWGGARETEPVAFRSALQANINKRYEAFVTDYSPEEYQEMGAKTYLLDDGKSGYALKPDGDIISAFSSNGRGYAVMKDAVVRGGKKLDCFDGKLPSIYRKHGFREYERWAWDDQYAPPRWNYEEFDRPDVVLMRLEES